MDEKLVIQITAEISDLKKQVADAKAEVEKLADDSTSSASKIDETFKNAGESIKSGLAIAAKAGAAAYGALTGAVVLLTQGTEEYRVAQAKLDSAWEAAGKTAGEASAAYNDLYRFMGESDTAVEAANHLAQLNLTQEENKELTTALQGVFATFGDSIPIEGLAEAVNHTAKLGEVQGPLADALEWSGISQEEFNAKLAE
jgi:hypothetical protein